MGISHLAVKLEIPANIRFATGNESMTEQTTQKTIALEPGTLWARVTDRTNHALNCGALHSIPSTYELVEQDGIRFLVRILANLVRKDEAKLQQDRQLENSGRAANPFLPYEEDLFVADLSQTHVCLLNKYNVVNYHLLIITRAFEEQEALLTLQDMAAMATCLAEIDGLVFYNGGSLAGASQRHKHLQLVPLPLLPDGAQIPIAPAIATAQFCDSIGSSAEFPFVHAIARLNPDWLRSPSGAAEILLCYQRLLRAVGLQDHGSMQSGAYNLLVTRQWMLMVPRTRDNFEAIAVNALGFAGAMLVRSPQQLQRLKECRPLTILKQVAVPLAFDG